MNVLLAGASGMIGRAVRSALDADGHAVRVLRRGTAGPDTWDPDLGRLPAEAIEWADAVISLNGASLTKLPWTRAYRDLILSSRVDSTRLIADAIARADSPPTTWVSASAVGVYGDRPGETLTEDSPRGQGFLADVVTAWEAAADAARDATRVVLARTGVVLGPEGALTPLARLARIGLGGPLGGGRQHWPWIGLDDEARAIVHLATASALAGPVNLVAPTPATASNVTRAVAAALHRPHVMPAPAWALRLALGDAARDLLFADQRVSPARLLAEGTFVFAHPGLDDAVREALRATPARPH